MDATRFDGLTRRLGHALSRRHSLVGLVAVVTALAGDRSDAAAAPVQDEACLPLGKRCTDRRSRCCGTTTCRRGRCRCKRTKKICRGRCIAKAACCGPCRAGQSCVAGTCRGCGQGGPCTVFVTSEAHPGALGGLAGADAICQRLAAAAGVSGQYLAWLSTAAQAPARRFTRSPGPYRLVDGTVLSANWTALTEDSLHSRIDRTETGDVVADFRMAWTNTRLDGTRDTSAPIDDCAEWTASEDGSSGSGGYTFSIDGGWTQDALSTCDVPNALYCFQQH